MSPKETWVVLESESPSFCRKLSLSNARFASWILIYFLNLHPFKSSIIIDICTISLALKIRRQISAENKVFLIDANSQLSSTGGWKSQKKSHSKLRGKRATFTVWVDKSSLKMAWMKLAVKQCYETGYN